MARRGFGGTALRAALGAVTGVAEGLQQRQVVADEKKRMADAAALDQARFLISSGFRIAPPADDTIDPAARSILPSLEMPSTARSALPPMTMPSTAPRPSAGVAGALSAALNRDFKVDATKPSLPLGLNADPLALDSRTTRMTEVLGRGQEARAAQEAIAASVDLGGGMKVRFNAPESAAQITARKLADYEAQKRADAAITAQAKADELKAKNKGEQDLADAYVASFVDRNGKPISAAQALAAAKSGKTPLELGFSEKLMSAYESGSLAIAQRNAAVNEGKLLLDQGKTPANEIEKRLPTGARTEIADYIAAIRTLQEAQKEVANNPKAFGLMPVIYAKGGILGRAMRERSEGENSEAYTKARAQMQSALMKLRKTQFGTQMTKLEKDTGEEVFPSGAESSERLTQMLSVLVGNAEQLRRGVYEANNAADLYTLIVPDTQTTTAPEDPDFTAAKAYIAAGKDRNAVIQRYESSGKKWPGGA